MYIDPDDIKERREIKVFIVGFILGILFGVVLTITTSALAWDINGEIGRNFYSNDHLRDEGVSAKLTASPFDWAYLWGSYDDPRLTYGGQHCGSIPLYGVGVGFRYRPEVLPGLTFFLEGGWYFPDPDMSNRKLWFPTDQGAEGLALELNRQIVAPYAPHGLWWEWYEYSLEDDFGGGIGVSYAYPVTQHLIIGISTSYHYLHFDERIRGMAGNSRETGAWWEMYRDFDMSHWNISGVITYRW